MSTMSLMPDVLSTASYGFIDVLYPTTKRMNTMTGRNDKESMQMTCK
jgi:hypothetical protein